MPSKKKHTKKSVSKHTKHTAKASANSSPMNSKHSVEYCGVCRNKVKVSNITFVDLRVKNGTIRKRMIYLCENRGHEWGKFVSSKTKTVGNSNNKKVVHTGGAKTQPQQPSQLTQVQTYVPLSSITKIREQPLYNFTKTDESTPQEPTFREPPPPPPLPLPPRPSKTSRPPPPLPPENDRNNNNPNNIPSKFLITNSNLTRGSREPTHQSLANARAGKT